MSVAWWITVAATAVVLVAVGWAHLYIAMHQRRIRRHADARGGQLDFTRRRVGL